MTSSVAFARGKAYFEQGKVLLNELDVVNEQLEAQVAGSEFYPYEYSYFGKMES